MTKRILAVALSLVMVLPLVTVRADEAVLVRQPLYVTTVVDEDSVDENTGETQETPEDAEDAETTEAPEDTETPDDTETPEDAETPEDTEMAPTPTPVPTVSPFADVMENDWFAEDVKYVYEEGIMNGLSDNAFAPYTQMTRGMVVTVLARSSGAQLEEEIAEDTAVFEDVDFDSYYAQSVYWAQENGIVNGMDDTHFAPESNITREDFAVILYRYMEYKEITLPATLQYVEFADDSQISDYAKEALYTMFYTGIIKGNDGEGITVNPKGLANRAEVATMLHRFIEKAALAN